MSYTATFVCLTSLLLALPATASPPDDRIEVSEDGLVTVELPAAAEELVTAAAPEGVTVPYGTTPDWGNTLRRQVGGLVVADMDGDNLPDVVVACYNSQSFPPYEDWHNMIYYNTGTELEADPSWISADEVSTGDIKVALINGDDFPDVFAANGGFAMAPSVIYFGTAGGPSTTPGWSESGGSTWTNYALPFDVDHDGDIDVATANQGNSPQDPYRPMRLFLNDEGTLATVPAWQSAEMSISNFLSFGDLDGDDWEDLAVSKWANFESGIYKNVMGTLQTTPVWTTGDTDTDRGVAWADVDGDDDPDLALGHDPTLLYTNQSGTPTATWSASGTFFGHQDMAWADVDGDGDDDLAEVHFSNGVVNIYRNDEGTLTTSPWWSFDSPAVGTALAFGDINGDGALDLVVGNAGDVSVMVFYNQLGPVEIFTDGFESGDTSAWSSSVP